MVADRRRGSSDDHRLHQKVANLLLGAARTRAARSGGPGDPFPEPGADAAASFASCSPSAPCSLRFGRVGCAARPAGVWTCSSPSASKDVTRLDQAQVDAAALVFALVLSLAAAFYSARTGDAGVRGPSAGTCVKGGAVSLAPARLVRATACSRRRWRCPFSCWRRGPLTAPHSSCSHRPGSIPSVITGASRFQPGFTWGMIASPAAFERLTEEWAKSGVRFAALSSRPHGPGSSTNGWCPKARSLRWKNAFDSRFGLVRRVFQR